MLSDFERKRLDMHEPVVPVMVLESSLQFFG
jgi:hypothetical protein